MKTHFLLLIIILTLNSTNCLPQNKKHMHENHNPLLCNPDSGVCEIPGHNAEQGAVKDVKATKKPVKVIYYTDPICSSCWGIEPQLRKLKLEYGNSLEIE